MLRWRLDANECKQKREEPGASNFRFSQESDAIFVQPFHHMGNVDVMNARFLHLNPSQQPQKRGSDSPTECLLPTK